MVSFQCEGCGDVLTKKKLDQHRSQCRGASFSCLDCMVHFHGTEYRSHTSCITEDQKYQGALYKAKTPKANKRKSVSIADPKTGTAVNTRQAYVEDAADIDNPPHAPSPPPAIRPDAVVQPGQGVNVFDFLVNENTPNASRVSLGGSKEQMSMKTGAHSIFSGSQEEEQEASAKLRGGDNVTDEALYTRKGFSYGTEPVRPVSWAPNASTASIDFMTPAAKTKTNMAPMESAGHSRTNSAATSDKKRKRGSPEALDLSAIQTKGSRRSRHPEDTPMADAPPSSADTPGLSHSGLTGGLNRLLTEPRNAFPPTPDYSDGKEFSKDVDYIERVPRYVQAENPASPLKRSRTSKDTHTADPGFSIKGRAGRIMSKVGGANVSSSSGPVSALNPAGLQNKETALVRTKHRGSSSSDSRPPRPEPRHIDHKKTKVQRPVSMFGTTRRESSSQADRDRYSVITNVSNTSRRRRGSDQSPEARRRKVKAIEYHHYPRERPLDEKERQRSHTHSHQASDSDFSDDESHAHQRSTTTRSSKPSTRTTANSERDMVIYNESKRLEQRAETFLSYVTKGPDSERGCSINKALKRWHRDGAGGEGKADMSKEEEMKELWRGLRLRRNDRGEIVVFY